MKIKKPIPKKRAKKVIDAYDRFAVAFQQNNNTTTKEVSK